MNGDLTLPTPLPSMPNAIQVGKASLTKIAFFNGGR